MRLATMPHTFAVTLLAIARVHKPSWLRWPSTYTGRLVAMEPPCALHAMPAAWH